jgi:hypothetical protein
MEAKRHLILGWRFCLLSFLQMRRLHFALVIRFGAGVLMNISERLRSILSYVVGVFTIIWAVIIYIFPPSPDENNQQLLGIWFSKYNYPIPAGSR